MSDEEKLFSKLQAALSAKSVVEKEVIQELLKVREVCEQRTKNFEQLKSEETKLLEQLKTLNTEHKMPALLKGKVLSAASAQAVSNTVLLKLDRCRENLENSYTELQRAKNRELQVEESLSQIRTEQKQIEKIIENRSFLSKIVNEAVEEISVEELLTQRKK
jgi:hypothetical protein